MNKAELLAKFQAKTAATTEQTTTAKSKLKTFTFVWNEATTKYDNYTCNTWARANEIFRKFAALDLPKQGEGYSKSKICIVWENGATITDRVDLSETEGDFNPKKQTIQEFLKPQKGVMYESNLNEGYRQNLLSWEDEAQSTEAETIPQELKRLLGIVETIEESNDTSDAAALKAAEQVERCEAYIVYLQSILPILKAKANAIITQNKTKASLN